MGKQYEMAFQIGAKVQGSFGAAFKSASASVQSLQSTINELNKKQSDISSYQKTQTALEQTRNKLKLYEQQYANMKAAIEGNENATYQEQNAMLAKAKAIDDLKAKQEGLEQKLRDTGEALQEEGVNLDDLGNESQAAAQQVEELRNEQEALTESSGSAAQGIMELVSALGAMEAIKQVAEAFKQCAEEAIVFESSMAAVKRTVGGDDAFIDQLGEDFKKLSTQIPITTEELAQIASTAGQLGIEQSKVEEFTTVMAKLATTTDLTADEAATMLAQFANITGVSDYERLGSVVAQLGDSTATTASKVVQMSQGMAASASIAGFSETDIMALAAAVGSLGIEAQAGSTSMSTLISTLYKATETGDKLEQFASVAGMSAEQFKQAWGEDAIGTMNRFIQGLNDTERNGRSAVVILDELGITNVRQTKAILGLASAGDLLTNTISQANQAWAENTALNEKAGIMYETTEAKLTMMQNAANNVQIAIGDAFTPAIGAAADALTGLLEPVAEFIEQNPALVQGIGAALAVMGGLTAAVVAYTAAAKIATAVSAALTAAIPGAKMLLAIGAAFAVVTGAVVALSEAFKDNTRSMEEMDAEYDNLTAQMQQEQHVIDLCEDYKALANQIESTVDASGKLQDFEDIELSLKPLPKEEVVPKDFLINGDPNLEITPVGDEDSLLNTEDLIQEGAEIVALTPEAKEKLEQQDMVGETGVTITAKSPDDKHKLDANVFVNGKKVEFHAEWDNRAAMEADIEAFKQKALSAKEDLNSARDALKEMQEYQAQLQARLQNAGTDSEQTSLKTQLENVNTVIGAQEQAVAKLEAEYEEAATQYVLTAQAADTLAEKDAELKRLEEEITGAASDTADAYSEQAGSIMETVAAKEALAKANQAELRSQMTANLREQGQAYAKAYGEYARQIAAFKRAQDDLNNIDTADDVGARLMKTYNEIGEALANGGDWDSGTVLRMRKQFEQLFTEVSGGGAVMSFGNYDMMGRELRDLEITTEDVTAAQAELGRQMKEANSAAEEASATMQTYIDNAISGVQDAGMTLDEVRELMEESFQDYPNGAQMVEEAMAQVEAAISGAAEAAEDFNDQTIEGATAADVEAATQPIIDKMNELAQAYTDAYNAAYASINGQFELFEKVELPKHSEDAQGAVEDMISALNSQTAYMDQYASNLKTAAEMGIDEGLIAKLSDGSTESAQILADIVAGGSDKIDQLNAAFAKVEDGKAKFADTVAEMQTDFSESMKKLEEDLQTTVNTMDHSDESAAAAARTVQAYAEAAAGQVGAVEDAFAQLSAAAQIKARVSFSFGGFNLGGIFGGLFGHADGTNAAQRGWSVVGEEGPELMYMHGGEKILNARDTESALTAESSGTQNPSTYKIEYKPQYNISGDADSEKLRAMLEEHDAQFSSKLEDMLYDISNDRGRREYA